MPSFFFTTPFALLYPFFLFSPYFPSPTIIVGVTLPYYYNLFIYYIVSTNTINVLYKKKKKDIQKKRPYLTSINFLFSLKRNFSITIPLFSESDNNKPLSQLVEDMKINMDKANNLEKKANENNSA